MNSKENITALVKGVVRGDMIAAEQLYEKFAQAMFHISVQMTQDKMLTEDILQESFTKSFVKIDQLKIASQYGGWLKRMVINASIDAVKKRKSWEAIDPNVMTTDQDGDGTRIDGIDQPQLKKAIAELPEKSRLVFCLFLLEGKTHKTIADLLNINISTSKSQYQYALKLLRKKLKRTTKL